MLDSLYIKNFRLFKELTIEHLGQINLIVGQNNSGKTSLLEALWIYGSKANPQILSELITKREEYWEGEGTDTDKHPLRYFFYEYFLPKDGGTIEIGSLHHPHHRDILKLALNRDGQIWRSYYDSMNNQFYENHFALNKRQSQDDDEEQQSNIRFLSNKGLNIYEMDALWNNIVLTVLEERLLEGLKILNKKIEKINIIKRIRANPGHPLRRANDNQTSIIPLVIYNNKRLPLKNLGEGLMRIFNIMLSLVNARNGLLLIDIIDNELHYSILPEVWVAIFKLAKELNVQIFATTHSADCINAFQQAAEQCEEKNHTLLRLGQSVRILNKAQVIASTYNDEALRIITQARLDIR